MKQSTIQVKELYEQAKRVEAELIEIGLLDSSHREDITGEYSTVGWTIQQFFDKTYTKKVKTIEKIQEIAFTANLTESLKILLGRIPLVLTSLIDGENIEKIHVEFLSKLFLRTQVIIGTILSTCELLLKG